MKNENVKKEGNLKKKKKECALHLASILRGLVIVRLIQPYLVRAPSAL